MPKFEIPYRSVIISIDKGLGESMSHFFLIQGLIGSVCLFVCVPGIIVYNGTFVNWENF